MSVRLVAAMVAGFLLSSGAVWAQELDGPVNLPPAGFDGQQFVDNAGCAFARAGISGNIVWVPRVDQSREQICGLAPTFAAPVAVAEAPAPAPVPVAEPVPASEAPGAPIRTVASMVTPPAEAVPVAAAETSSGLAEGVLQTRSATACIGRTGPQPDLIDARTGEMVDCGGTEVGAQPEPEPPSMTLAEACARQAATGVSLRNVVTGELVACPDAVAEAPAMAPPAAREMTLAAACAEQVATGVRFRDSRTGELLACPVADAPVMAAAPAGRETPATVATVAQTVAAQTPRRIDPLSAATISGSYALGPTDPIRVGDVLSAETISGVVTQIHYGAPAGFDPVWADGRINPDRGLPEVQARVPVAAAETVSTMNVPQPQAVAQGGFVQVGTYGEPANAARAEAVLRGLGLPVAVSPLTSDGQVLQVVAAGPLSGDALQAALRAARSAGYGDAFIR
jgi:hypothetical protein